jgi:pilus assembly protein CpaB
LRRRTIALGFAVVFALMATGLVWWYVDSLKGEMERDAQEVTVLVARADIPGRTKGDLAVSKNLVVEQRVAQEAAAPGALTAASQLVGRIIQADVAEGQQIVTSQVVTPEDEGLAFRIPQGMRAAAVSVSRVDAVGGMIRPGDRVDVIATFDYEVFNQANVSAGQVLSPEQIAQVSAATGLDLGASKAAITRMILTQVEVLRIDPVDDIAASESTQPGGKDTPETPDRPVVVLLVTPEDAEKVVFAEQQGRISLSLVPAEDEIPSVTPGRAIMNAFSPSTQQPIRMNPITKTAQTEGPVND